MSTNKTAKIELMKALNIAQPHAHNVMFNGKNVENRTMATTIRGTIAIYGSKTYKKAQFDSQDITDVKKEDCSYGCILGFVDVVDCITEDTVSSKTRKWFSGPYGYVFENLVVLKTPIEVTPPQGAIIWWDLTGARLQQCLAQLPASAVITPLKHAKMKPGAKKPKFGGRTRLTPTAMLAKIIGPEPVSYMQSMKKFMAYLYENKLIEGDNKDWTIMADDNLRQLFGKTEIVPEEVKDVFMKNLIEKKAA